MCVRGRGVFSFFSALRPWDAVFGPVVGVSKPLVDMGTEIVLTPPPPLFLWNYYFVVVIIILIIILLLWGLGKKIHKSKSIC